MEDELDGRDVETSGCDVCGYQYGRRRRGGRKALHGAEPGFLGHLGVQGVGGEIEVLEEWCETTDGGYRVGEDERARMWVEE